MTSALRRYIQFAMVMLLLALLFGVIASFAFLYPEFYNKFLPFYQLRPMHVSSALFWIISGATSSILFFKKEVFHTVEGRAEKAFIYLWMASILSVFVFYSLKKFGGREYWEFPPALCIPILVSWICLMYSYFKAWRRREKKAPLYIWMWTTGICFFLITFLEQNLYQISWFRSSFLRDITVQWKSNGAMVGAWNQMIYGTSLYLMVKLSGDKQIAENRKAFFFYFLGLTNLMFNWGHHIYNVPGASWIRHVSYAISMTEWIILINIIHGFKRQLSEQRKYRHIQTYRFLIAAEYWVFLNLILALFMSIPAINRYTHGTHITVAHAMGATIGINTMILLGAINYIIQGDSLPGKNRQVIKTGFTIAQISLFIFWLALIVAGVLKGYRDVALAIDNYQEMMRPVNAVLHVFSFSGLFLFAGIAMIVSAIFKNMHSQIKNETQTTVKLEKVKTKK